MKVILFYPVENKMSGPFENMIKFGVKITRKNGKKSVSGMPQKWPDLTSSVYNNEVNYAILTGKTNDIIVVDLG